MREIKFRAWDPVHKSMHYSSDCTLDWLFGLVERHGATVEEYMGLKDKNGKEIYEGDIVQYFSMSFIDAISGEQMKRRVNAVHWSEEELAWYVGTFKPCKSVDDGQFEIIGNINEHADLLKGAGG